MCLITGTEKELRQHQILTSEPTESEFTLDTILLVHILFVIQMKDILNFTPNRRTQPTFCRILREAHRSGVHILAYDCNVWEKGMEIDAPVEVIL